MNKKLFISYSDFDKDKMRFLEKIIYEHKGLVPIIIADNRKALKQLTEKVSKGIRECNYFIPILTNKSIKTQWVNQEIGFATALNREIIPIVDSQIIDELKGFIHKQLDLSYSFESNSNSKRSESIRFCSAAKILIEDIASK